MNKQVEKKKKQLLHEQFGKIAFNTKIDRLEWLKRVGFLSYKENNNDRHN